MLAKQDDEDKMMEMAVATPTKEEGLRDVCMPQWTGPEEEDEAKNAVTTEVVKDSQRPQPESWPPPHERDDPPTRP